MTSPSATVREILEARERQFLAPYAALSSNSKGRQRPDPEHEYRTAYQRDRDRILHCKSFRRLKRKTQVFLAPEGDHYRTRLTHTLEASQIARTAARALGLNEDLTEAIALGHDMGHTPFGHAGESVLNELYADGFRHCEQSLRVVECLESTHSGPGLNLTWEVRDGIVNHSKGKSLLQGARGVAAGTLEGQLFSVCDAIAYINHDIDDALRAGIITLMDLPQDSLRVLGESTSERINTMVIALIRGSESGEISLQGDVLEATNTLRNYMYNHVYPHPAINTQIEKAKRMLRELYHYLLINPTHENLPTIPGDTLERSTVDFLAGMTDQYALSLYQRLFFPASWPS